MVGTPDRAAPDSCHRRSKRRLSAKLGGLERDYLSGRLNEREMQSRATALFAFAQATGVKSWRFRSGLVASLAVGGQGLEPCHPGR